MPHFRFRGLQREQVQQLSQTLLGSLAAMVGAPEDWFTFEHVPSQFFFAGEPTKQGATVEVQWFDRGGQTEQKVASYITEQVRALPCGGDIVVIFTLLEPKHYYENGVIMG